MSQGATIIGGMTKRTDAPLTADDITALQSLPDLPRALTLAARFHADQTDKADAPYLLHPLRVMQQVETMPQKLAALLHDLVEDTPVTLEDLRALGFGEEVVRAVGLLTKREDESYFDFVERAGADDVARAVKLADIEDNMNLDRLPNPTDKDRERVTRYGRARKLLHVIGGQRGDARVLTPTILPLKSGMRIDEVQAECPGDRPVFVCDFYLDGAERGTEEPGGLRLGRMLNVDHHASLPSMYTHRTSTRLAFEHLRAGGPLATAAGAWVVINHTDCDSMLSSAMLLGHLPPDERFVRASVAADHTGEVDEIAELLQGLDEDRSGQRTEAQYLESLRNLRLLLNGEPLEPVAELALLKRRRDRAAAEALVAAGALRRDGALAWAMLEDELDGAYFASRLEDAAVVMLATRFEPRQDRWVVKIRLGAAAPPGLSLHALEIRAWDEAFGGRWNAGSNKRGEGTALHPEEYAARLGERVRSFVSR